MRRRPALLVAAGIAAFLLFLVALMPARVLLRFVPPQVSLSGVSGTVWRGKADSVSLHAVAGSTLVRGSKPIGSLRWSFRPWRLAALELSYRVELKPPGGQLAMNVSLGRGGLLRLGDVKGSFPVAAVDQIVAPAGWRGTVELDVARLDLSSQTGFPTAADGTATVRHLTAAGPGGIDIGSYELTLGQGAVGTREAIAGRLRDLGDGPMRVRGTLKLNVDGSYLLSGDVTAMAGAGPAVLNTLVFLGPPDSLGRRQFGIEGTL